MSCAGDTQEVFPSLSHATPQGFAQNGALVRYRLALEEAGSRIAEGLFCLLVSLLSRCTEIPDSAIEVIPTRVFCRPGRCGRCGRTDQKRQSRTGGLQSLLESRRPCACLAVSQQPNLSTSLDRNRLHYVPMLRTGESWKM